MSLHSSSSQTHEPQSPTRVRHSVICGPLLRYINIDYDKQLWRGSCLIVSTDRDPQPCLELEMRSQHGETRSVKTHGELLDSFRDQYHFWRFELQLPLLNEAQTVTYWIRVGKSFTFHLASLKESMRFMFYSCNGFSDISQQIKDLFGGGTAPLWADALDRHEIMPFHVMLGGGDQLYQDRLIHEDYMKLWCQEKDPKKRIAMQLSGSMREGFEQFYFWNYIKNFGFKENPVVARALASIPSVNMWDDHHTTIKLAQYHGLIQGFLPTCQHIVTTLGPDIGLLAMDARGERTKYDICRPQSYDKLFEALYHMPQSVKHVLVLTGVPLIYPRLTVFEKAMDSVASFDLATLAGKTGALGNAIGGQLNKWNGDPELLDDMNDHWTAGNHMEERRIFILRLQQYARDRSIRISFLGGDVSMQS
ncbi:hypothetical protein DFQ29_001774 [Apophysomyces sp. BC1021]|nr:hypothetical protein DFQ29_001774 [Apophysomyces sp. BC1021]